jgi:hypothetical protein|tara:strand:+ start:414 stop:833 length:420 start_codon:yes stop_codon:yes gene_type:complete
MNVGDHVQWTSTDSEGKFSTRGLITGMKDNMVEILTMEGTIGFPEDDGLLKAARPVKGMKGRIKSNDKKPKKAKSSSPKIVPATGSRIEQMLTLFSDARDTGLVPNRSETIQQAVEMFGMTPAGASTYYAKAKKELNLI